MSEASRNPDYKALLRQAYDALQQMQTRLDAVERARHEPIAIVGLSCRFPGGANPRAYWELLRQGVDATREFPRERFDIDAFHSPDPTAPGKTNARRGGFLEGVDGFDPQYFGLSPREAALMDPQQRLFLETSWEALEDAGIVPASLAGTATGVFVGVYNDDYQWLDTSVEAIHDAYNATGTAHSVLPGRLSFLLDLRGPSLAVDTACSSSLVAVHLACQSLRTGESDIALAGGVNLILSPRPSILLSKLQVLAPDGRCKTFDASANGFSRGEGAGVLVLKRLSRAQADGDRILALIRGSAVNQDGRSAGLTAPNPRAQADLIRQALKMASLAPSDISYVEAHGTGTPLGDPIEIEALAEVFGSPQPDGTPCLVGSVKTNFGHLEAAAGIAGLIKVVLSMAHAAIPPHLHLTTLNPRIRLEGTRLAIPTALTPWPALREGGRRCAGVSSFGVGGTNAHVILEDAAALASRPASREAQASETLHVLPLSARSPEALGALARSFRDFLTSTASDPAPSLVDVCHTAGTARSHHAHRLAVVGATHSALVEQLDCHLRGEPSLRVATSRVDTSSAPGVVFVFPGQGSQWAGMGRTLSTREPVFRAALEQCADAVARHGGWSLSDVLREDADGTWLDRSDRIQPAVFAMQVALAALWKHWGVIPDVVVGHSMGEVAAACVAGALSLDDAARIICKRSALLTRVRGRGAMAVIELPAWRVEEIIGPHHGALCIAAINGPTTTIVAGDAAPLSTLLDDLQRQNVFCRPVRVDVASHSPHVDPLREELLTALEGLHPLRGSTPLRSTVTGKTSLGEDLDAGYWVRNLRQPVQFLPAIRSLLDEGRRIFIELSPHPVLLTALEQTIAERGAGGIALPSMRRDAVDQDVLMESVAALYAHGAPIDFSKMHPGGRRITLPTYPFQRTRHWLDLSSRDGDPAPVLARSRGRHPLLGARLLTAHPVFEAQHSVDGLPFLGDHRLNGTAFMPGSAYIEMAFAAARETLGGGDHSLRNLSLDAPLTILDSTTTVQTICTERQPGTLEIEVFSRQQQEGSEDTTPFQRHAIVEVVREGLSSGQPARREFDVLEIQGRCPELVDIASFYEQLEKGGLAFGPLLRGVHSLWRRDGEALGRIELPEGLRHEAQDYTLHPALLDAALQVLGSTLPGGGPCAGERGPLLLASIGSVRWGERAGRPCWSHAESHEVPDGGALGNVRLLDERGRTIVELLDLRLRRASRTDAISGAGSALDAWRYEVQWERSPLDVSTNRDGRRWLLFADGTGVAEALARQIEQSEGHCVQVRPGAEYETVTDSRVVIVPGRPDHVARLLDEAEARGMPYDGVIHLWSLDGTVPEPGAVGDEAVAQSLAHLERSLHLTCGSTLTLVQALTQPHRPSPPRLWLVTRNAQAFDGTSERLDVQGAALWGFGRSVGLEHPAIWGGLVDLDEGAHGESARLLMAQITHGGEEDQAAFRRGIRHVPRLARVDSTPPSFTALPVIQPDGSYLITGGLGGVGLRVARWLVERGARHVTLLGRAGLPPREAWSTEPGDTPRRRVMDTIATLEAAGASVDVVAVDVADLQGMRRVFARFGYSSPALRGVVHAASAVDPLPVREMTSEALLAACRAKVLGGWILHNVAASSPLDLFVLFSSTSGIWGAGRLAHYAAANQFLDALAQLRRQKAQPGSSIAWGLWNEGRGASEEMQQWSAQVGLIGMAPARALDAMQRVLAGDTVHQIVADVDWRLLKPSYEARRRRPLFASIAITEAPTLGGAGVRSALLVKLHEAPPRSRKSLLQAAIQKEVARILRLPPSTPIEPRQGFFELGMDSLMSLELRNRLQVTLGHALPTTLAFDHPTIASLTGFLVSRVLQLDLGEAEPAPTGHVEARTEETSSSSLGSHGDDLDALEEDETEALLERRLAGLEKRLST
ncbi:type I polyketide synthase [Chondromyces crocatus]|nr:type I polyketide synthase [Chondromyces crocatus]AKT41165.1 polyketide synthase [Chondromyces crocatus]